MSDEDSLFKRYTRCFWHDYLGGLYSVDFGVQQSAPTCGPDTLLTELRVLAEHVRTAGFSVSRNEDIEDVSSVGLLFLLIPYAIGDLLYNHTRYDRDGRIPVLKEVKSHLDTFLMNMEQLNISIDLSCLDERTRKIESHRKQNELKEFVSKVHFSLCRRPVVLDDIDCLRDDILKMLEYFTLKASNDTRFVNDEIELLRLKPDDARMNVQAVPNDGKKLWSMKLDRTLIRSMIQKEVFRPDISMPRVSLEEFARMEYQRALERSTGKPSQHPESDDDAYSRERIEELQEEKKNRLWDDWKDENPRGSGNKLVNKG